MVGACLGQARDDDKCEDDEHEHDDDPSHAGCAGDTEVVDGSEGEDRGDGHGLLPSGGCGVCGEGQGHGGAAGRLADDETPPCEEARPFAETVATVDVGAA